MKTQDRLEAAKNLLGTDLEHKILEKMQFQWKTIRKAFQDMNVSKTGKISKDEFNYFLQFWGMNITDEQFDAVFSKFDLDGDGHVTHEELCEYIDERVDGKGRGDEEAYDDDGSLADIRDEIDELDHALEDIREERGKARASRKAKVKEERRVEEEMRRKEKAAQTERVDARRRRKEEKKRNERRRRRRGRDSDSDSGSDRRRRRDSSSDSD